ncbi:MAG: GNAT family N-acetyltransferase [Planctomycetota bacterium]|nr:GNAT family N-acetyltransferase [Planctomycetota bacterium]
MIRRFRPSDLERVKEITLLGFEGVSIDHGMEKRFGVIAGKDWKWRKARSLDDDVEANSDGVFVYEADGAVVGYITTRLDAESAIGWIPNIAIDPGHQGRGIGRALMQAALDYLRASGMRYAKIETLEQNQKGQAFYPSVGFQEVARQIHYLMRL